MDEDGNHPSELPKILVGVCAMDRKVGSCQRLAARVVWIRVQGLYTADLLFYGAVSAALHP